MRSFLEVAKAGAIDAGLAAQRVLARVERNRLHILTNGGFLEGARQRSETILAVLDWRRLGVGGSSSSCCAAATVPASDRGTRRRCRQMPRACTRPVGASLTGFDDAAPDGGVSRKVSPSLKDGRDSGLRFGGCDSAWTCSVVVIGLIHLIGTRQCDLLAGKSAVAGFAVRSQFRRCGQ